MILSPNGLGNMEKLFKNVRKLILLRCGVGQQFLRLPTIFPELRHLEIYRSGDFRRVRENNLNFPHLEKFGIGIDNRDISIGFSLENFKMILNQNPQLKSLEIANPFKQEFIFKNLLEIIDQCKSLTKLEILYGGVKTYTVSGNQIKRLANALPALVELHAYQYRFTRKMPLI